MYTTLILIRHGQTEWNRVERFRGRFDVPLNAAGVEQAERTARHVIKHWQPQAVYSSPLSRAVQTAKAIASSCGQSVIIEPALADIDYGEWQGYTPAEAKAIWPQQAAAWYEHPETALIPGGETLQQVRSRAAEAVFRAAEMHSGQTFVMVSHTVVNRLILLEALKLGNDRFWRLRQEPCAVNVIEIEGQECTLRLLNDTCHLEG